MYSTVGISQHISISRLPFSFYFRPRAVQADLVPSHILSSIWSVSFSGHVVQVGIKVFFSLFYLVNFLFRPRGADMPQSIFFSRLPFIFCYVRPRGAEHASIHILLSSSIFSNSDLVVHGGLNTFFCSSLFC